MNVIDSIEAHRSIRKFTSDPIGEETMGRILDAASRASTAGGTQLYSIIVTEDAERRRVLAGAHLGSETIAAAAAVLTFAVDTRRLGRWLELEGHRRGQENLWGLAMGFSDALLAAQNALLAAESLGLGGCFLGSTLVGAPAIRAVLALPPGVVAVATLVLGRPAESPPKMPRLPRGAVVHRETYRDPTDAELKAAYADFAPAAFAQLSAAPSAVPLVALTQTRDLAAYFARLNYPHELTAAAGACFMATVEAQGICSDAELARVAAVRRAFGSAAIGGLHPMRQLLWTLALTSGHLDRKLDADPAETEAALDRFIAERDPAIAGELATKSFFEPETRRRLYGLFAAFGA